MWQVDESVTGSVNSFWSAKQDSAGAESCRGLSPAFGGGTAPEGGRLTAPQKLLCVLARRSERFHSHATAS